MRALADPGSRTRTNVFTRLQRSYGNAAVQGLVQRYQAGETGHGGIEQRALTSPEVGMSADDASQVYFGNWLRDLSQLPPKAVPLINVLALGELIASVA